MLDALSAKKMLCNSSKGMIFRAPHQAPPAPLTCTTSCWGSHTEDSEAKPVKRPRAKSWEHGASSRGCGKAGMLARRPDLFPVLPGALFPRLPLPLLLRLRLGRGRRRAVKVPCAALLLRCRGAARDVAVAAALAARLLRWQWLLRAALLRSLLWLVGPARAQAVEQLCAPCSQVGERPPAPLWQGLAPAL